MVGTTLVFSKRVKVGTDANNNPTYEIATITVANCLIAPIREPLPTHEQQAISQDRDRLRVHMPKTSTDDVSDSTVAWDGKNYMIDSDSTVFMPENTPGQWNRYYLAEAISG